jgi:hypothetical protein
MKLTLTVTGLKEVQSALAGFSDRRMSSVLASALTATARDGADAVKAEMGRVFDRPRPFTLGGARFKPANANDLTAEVFLAEQGAGGRGAGKYLKAEVRGGQRKQTGLERALQKGGLMQGGWYVVPGAGARLDSHGNIQRSQLQQIAQGVSGMRSKAQARRAGGDYFAVPTRQKKGLPPGIYLQPHGRRVRPVLVLRFVRSVTYPVRLNFEGVVRETAALRFAAHFDRYFNASALRLLARGR